MIKIRYRIHITETTINHSDCHALTTEALLMQTDAVEHLDLVVGETV